jgi:hypothetical protein
LLSARDPIRRRQPIERPLDVIALELMVSVTQALLAGILLSLAAQLGGDARAYGLPVPGLLAVLALAVGVGWLRWLVGGTGWLMASVCLGTAILTGALWLLSLQDASLPRVDWLVGLLAASCAIYGLVAGVFLDGPHRTHWKGGISQPRRGMPETRSTPARFSPPVQRVVDDRLTNVRLPQVRLPTAARLKAVAPPRSSRTTDPPSDASGDGLSIAAEVVPHPPTSTQPVADADAAAAPVPEALAPEAAVAPDPTAPEPVAPEPSAPVEARAEAATPSPSSQDATEVVGWLAPAQADPTPRTESPDAADADPDAPTRPVTPAPTTWPRPIEPRGTKPYTRGEGGDLTS